MARKTKEDTQATREGILDAAETCFHEHGVARGVAGAVVDLLEMVEIDVEHAGGAAAPRRQGGTGLQPDAKRPV